jgi:hypothetical protein
MPACNSKETGSNAKSHTIKMENLILQLYQKPSLQLLADCRVKIQKKRYKENTEAA